MEFKGPWQTIPGYEGLYEISYWGKVKSFHKEKAGTILLPQHDGGGYCYVGLRKKGVRTNRKIHRLVAEAFIPNPENKPQVNHIDEDKDNNTAPNLGWATPVENTNHGTGMQRRATLCEKGIIQMDVNYNIISVWRSAKEASLQGFDTGHIAKCCKGKAPHHWGFKWQYV